MPSKKKKYNARFPAGRIKKIMQTDEDVGKVAQAVPVIISRTLELFVESLLKKAMEITSAKNAKTLSPSHMKQCILSENRFDFLKDLVISIPDVASCDYDDGLVQPNTNSEGRSETASSGTWLKQEGTSISSNRNDRGFMPPSSAPAAVSSNKMNLNFYKESEEANVSGTESLHRHAAARTSLACGQDAEDSGSENEQEYQVPAVVRQYLQPKASALVDEDYDT